MIGITLIINGHREGSWLSESLEAARKSIRYASERGVKGELLLILDKTNAQTLSIAQEYIMEGRVRRVEFGDLSKSRNYGVGLVSTELTAFSDGDDIISENWVYLIAQSLAKSQHQNKFVRPQEVVFFRKRPSRPFARYFQKDLRPNEFESRYLFQNPFISPFGTWTSNMTELPFPVQNRALKVGLEDWSHSLRSLLDGYFHEVALGTSHFVRLRRFSYGRIQTLHKTSPDYDYVFNRSV